MERVYEITSDFTEDALRDCARNAPMNWGLIKDVNGNVVDERIATNKVVQKIRVTFSNGKSTDRVLNGQIPVDSHTSALLGGLLVGGSVTSLRYIGDMSFDAIGSWEIVPVGMEMYFKNKTYRECIDELKRRYPSDATFSVVGASPHYIEITPAAALQMLFDINYFGWDAQGDQWDKTFAGWSKFLSGGTGSHDDAAAGKGGFWVPNVFKASNVSRDANGAAFGTLTLNGEVFRQNNAPIESEPPVSPVPEGLVKTINETNDNVKLILNKLES